jgi:hypothetical protein
MYLAIKRKIIKNLANKTTKSISAKNILLTDKKEKTTNISRQKSNTEWNRN